MSVVEVQLVLLIDLPCEIGLPFLGLAIDQWYCDLGPRGHKNLTSRHLYIDIAETGVLTNSGVLRFTSVAQSICACCSARQIIAPIRCGLALFTSLFNSLAFSEVRRA